MTKIFVSLERDDPGKRLDVGRGRITVSLERVAVGCISGLGVWDKEIFCSYLKGVAGCRDME